LLAKVFPDALKSQYFIRILNFILFSFILVGFKRIPGWEFEIYSKSGWFSGILNQI
jgi:hypothetical protein